MPIYEYVCKNCGYKIEVIEPKYKKHYKCPKCGGIMDKIISECSFRLYGDGWYKPSKKGGVEIDAEKSMVTS